MLIFLFTANLQTSNPHLQPPTEELAQMAARASEVVRLLEALRNDTPIFPSSLLSSTSTSAPNALVPVHPHSLDVVTMGTVKGVGSSLGMAIMDVDTPDRAPKRPWEDVEGMLPLQGQGQATPQSSGAAAAGGQGNNTDQDRTVAEADMEIIRTKRALTTLAAAAALGSGGGGTGGGKNKYRKRSVSLSICLSTLCVVLTVIAARDASWQVSFLQYSGDTGVETGTRWCADVVQCLWIAYVIFFLRGSCEIDFD